MACQIFTIGPFCMHQKTFPRKAALLLSASLGLAAVPSVVSAKPAVPLITYDQYGLDLAGRNMSVKPGDSFFDYANGSFLKTLEIPSDMSSYGPFNALAETSRQRIQSILKDLSAHPVDDPQSINEKLGTYYASFMDEKAVEAVGAKPLEAEIATIHQITDLKTFAQFSGASATTFGSSPFAVDVDVDAKDPTKYALSIDHAGLGMPDRDNYLKPEFASKKAAYQTYVTTLLTLVHWADPTKSAADIVAFETEIAKVHWARTELRDPDKTYNPMTVAALVKSTPSFDWMTWLLASGVPAAGLEQRTVIVGEPSAIKAEADLIARTDLNTLRAWQAFHMANNSASFLSDPFVQARFAYAKAMSGQPALAARWKRGVDFTSAAMEMALGKIYVDRYFPASDRAAMQTLTGNLKAAFHNRLEHNTWMSAQTRDAALKKLGSFEIQVGYPNEWRDYSDLVVKKGDVYGNAERAFAFEWHYQLSHLDKVVDRNEWLMSPATVNAYNNPRFVEVVFPAAILQPPFFNPKADPAVNYGAIGGVIGHEMTHSFDDKGRKYDDKGRLRNWWTKEDGERFQKLADRFGAQYDAFEVQPGVHVNGQLTMGENIADLGGLTLALDAYHASLNGKPAPVIDGLTGDQRVFMGWAQVWRQKLRPDTEKQLVVIDPHSPPKARVNIPMHNIDLWYKAWNVQPGDKLYLTPDQRVKIW
ncbi:metallopeptidase [Gluconobacter thailandicus F149-1 = NBRC 100600]|uniref:Metalloprotease n=1 Tax=Gluconobacter thailandicus NBRC 3257 TaxID=1381097 RepID=A0ABQ0IU70_GLUTH|nr:M13 family metallopeptidase [Gluconobacter thailandicus]GAD25761.1 metalloprotease [Gluconobacter thailandicus NBRC 3257]KXV53149.1 peptidase M13 [Gluconobacter thailandicus]GAC88072.1 metalloprotease [Gluconobacter thailandicus NBRC 3255]GAN93956.1 metallopeptidase [Gluconobacter thailandicus F149-1 = NBRC 100600]GBR60282.1 metallopeptidase [Gluconobacter thailandicus F149-1 = NBRC 100600]